MDWGTWGQWAGVGAALLIASWGALSRRNDKEIEDLKSDRNKLFQRIDDVERDVARIEVELTHLPKKEDLHLLSEAVTALRATITVRLDTILQAQQQITAQFMRAEERAIDAERELRNK